MHTYTLPFQQTVTSTLCANMRSMVLQVVMVGCKAQLFSVVSLVSLLLQVAAHTRLECPPPRSGETGAKKGPCDAEVSLLASMFLHRHPLEMSALPTTRHPRKGCVLVPACALYTDLRADICTAIADAKRGTKGQPQPKGTCDFIPRLIPVVACLLMLMLLGMESGILVVIVAVGLALQLALFSRCLSRTQPPALQTAPGLNVHPPGIC